jgi:LysM repeat protein
MNRDRFRSFLSPRFTRRFFVQALQGSLIVLVLTACGQVVTIETPTIAPVAAATPAMSLSTVPPRPTVTRALPTAAPPDTPTPSPTPIYHEVQSGETLIAIALQYGVTVAALQSANGISDPSTLQVGQDLIIPTGEESRGDNADLLLPTPTAVDFSIEGLTCHEDTAGSLWCLGEVVNSTISSLENVQLRVTLHNAAGEELAGGDVYAALDLIPSGQRAPFGVLFATPPDSFERFLARPIRAESSSEPASRYATLEVNQVEVNPVGSLFEVAGTVTNPGQQTASGVTVVVTTYDADGQVTGFRQARLSDDLAAGSSLGFAVSLMPYGGVPANYAIAVQGRLATQ